MEEARAVEREHKHGVEADLSVLFGLDRLISKSTREVLGLLLDRRDAFLEAYLSYMEAGSVVQDEGDRMVIRQLFCDLWLHSTAYLLDVGNITISQRNRLLQDLTDLFCCREGASENYYRNVEQNPAYLSYMQSCFGINAQSPYLFWRFVFSVDEKGTEGFAANRLLDEYGGLLMQIGY